MILTAFTLFHIAISLVAIGSGLILLYGFLAARWSSGWNTLFLITTVATSVTGFFFPVHRFLPSHAIGILSLAVLSIAIPARYRFHLGGGWCRTYVITALIALYFNVFVLVAQMFQKIPALKALAPTQTEPPFKLTQLVVLVLFVILTIGAATRFHYDSVHALQLPRRKIR